MATLGIIGLGKMGGNMAERLRRGGHEVVGYDRSESSGRQVDSLEALISALPAPRVVWVMVQAGQLVWSGPTAELLTGGDVRDFADLSLVNELDVAEHVPGFLAEHGAYFRRLTELWAPVLSPAVLAEARRVLAT